MLSIKIVLIIMTMNKGWGCDCGKGDGLIGYWIYIDGPIGYGIDFQFKKFKTSFWL